jgi:chromosome segregation ATPase
LVDQERVWEEQLAAARAHAADQEQQLAAAREELASPSKQLAVARADLITAEEELAALQEKLLSPRKELAAIDEQLVSAKAKLAVTQAELMGTKKRFDAVQGELSRDTQFESDNQEEVKQMQNVLLGLRMEMQEGRNESEPKGSNVLTSFTTELTSSDLGSLGQTKSVPTDESDITTEEGRAD